MKLVTSAACQALRQEDFPKDLPRPPQEDHLTVYSSPFLHENIRVALVWLVSNITVSPFSISPVSEVAIMCSLRSHNCWLMFPICSTTDNLAKSSLDA